MTTATSPSYFAITATTGFNGVAPLTSTWRPNPSPRGQAFSEVTQGIVGVITYANLGQPGVLGTMLVARATTAGISIVITETEDNVDLGVVPLSVEWCTPIHLGPKDGIRLFQTVLGAATVELCCGDMSGDVFAQYIAAGLTGVSSFALPQAVALTRDQITWAPEGGGDATTFAEAFALLNSIQNGHVATVLLDRASALAPELRVPAGTWDIKSAIVTTTTYGDPSVNMVVLSDGAVIRNAGETFRSCSVKSESSLPVLDYDGLAPGSPPVIFLGLGAVAQNAGSAPMYVSPPNSFTVLVVQGGTIVSGSAPVIEIGAGATCYLRLANGAAIDGSAIVGPAGCEVLVVHDGTVKFPLGPFPGLDPAAIVKNLPLGLVGGAGPTAFRPFTGDPSNMPSVGTTFLDTDLGRYIYWDGAAWYYYDGTPV